MTYPQNCYPSLEQKSSLQSQRAKIVTPAWITTQLTSLILERTFLYRLRGLAMRPRNSSVISAIKRLVFIKSCFCDAQTANLYILNSFEKNPRTTFPIFHFLKAPSSWSMSLASHRMQVSRHHTEVLLFQISSQSLQGLWCMDSVNSPTCAELSKENISSTSPATLQPSYPAAQFAQFPCVTNEAWATEGTGSGTEGETAFISCHLTEVQMMVKNQCVTETG